MVGRLESDRPDGGGERAMAQSDSPDIQIDSVGKTVCPRCGMMVDVSGVSAFAAVTCNACSAQFAAPGKLAQYVLLKPIAHSRTAVSFKGFDTSMSRHVEVKVLLKELCGDARRVEAFQGEARALASLDNRNVARAFFVGEHEGRPYSVTELIEGKTLSQIISPDRPLSEVRVLKIAIDVAGVIRDLAGKSLHHGRISPDNIVLVGKGAVKLVNFSGGSDSDDDDSPGASHYLAPEQIRGRAVDFHADVYGLGATMFHALTGSPPFEGDDPEAIRQAHLTGSAPDARTVCKAPGEPMGDLVAQMLHADPARRCEGPEGLLLDMEAALEAAQTARRARGGDAAAALSVMTGSSSGTDFGPAAPARPRGKARRPAPAARKPAGGKGRAARIKRQQRLMFFGGAAVAAVVLVVAIVIALLNSSSATGSESFNGRGPETSAGVAVKGFDLAGWSVTNGGEFKDGALDLFNNIDGANHSISREIPPGLFKLRIDLENISLGTAKQYDIHIKDSPDSYITISIRKGVPVVGTYGPETGWQRVARGVKIDATAVSWEIELTSKGGRNKWVIACKPGNRSRYKLKLGSENLGYYAQYQKRLRPDVRRTIEIVSSGRMAKMSVDYYEYEPIEKK